MDLRQLECFAAVARHRHFTRAAEDLYLTQSAVSQQVRRLEASLGVTLLRRGGGRVELTAAGEELLARAEAILSDVARARAAMDDFAGGVARGAVRVATTTAEGAGLPEALAAFHRAQPGIRVALRHGAAGEVVDLVRRGWADLGVAPPPRPPPRGRPPARRHRPRPWTSGPCAPTRSSWPSPAPPYARR